MTERTSCPHCRRPQDRCVCGAVRPVANRTGVTIVQHPGERRHAFNTARLTLRALQRAQLHVAWPNAAGHLACQPDVPPGAALLYPRPGAPELAALAPEDRPTHLVVIDGTWPQARRVYRENPWLAALPHVQLRPEQPGQYRIRREPAAHCLSTIESIAAALAVLEPELDGLDQVLAGFTAMIDGQVDRADVARARRRLRVRPTRLQGLRARWDRVIVGYAESVGDAPVLTHWAAVRPSTGAVYQVESQAALAASWAAFAGPDPLMLCWSARAVALLEAAVGQTYEALSLRSVYATARGGLRGTLDAVVAREGCGCVPVPVAGKAAIRLGNALAIAEMLLATER